MSEKSGEARARAPSKVAALLPLALLESIRQHDRPRETLEDENLSESLPRRLGLTGVVESEIARYERAGKKRDRVPAAEVYDLFRLVLKRPDAEAILRDAGRRIATRRQERSSALAAVTRRVLPRPIAAVTARRAARRVLRRINGSRRPEVSGPPLTVRSGNSITASADSTGTACTLVAGLLEELIQLYLRERPAVKHPRCRSRGDAVCEWRVAD